MVSDEIKKASEESGLSYQEVVDGNMLFGDDLDPYVDVIAKRGSMGCAPLAVALVRREVEDLKASVRVLCLLHVVQAAAVVALVVAAATSAIW